MPRGFQIGRIGRYWLTLTLLVALVGLYAHQRGLYGLYLESKASAERLRNEQQELTTLQIKERRLEQRQAALDDDPVEIEAAVRRKKNLVREGEKVYRVFLADEEPAGIWEPVSGDLIEYLGPEPGDDGATTGPATRNPAE